MNVNVHSQRFVFCVLCFVFWVRVLYVCVCLFGFCVVFVFCVLCFVFCVLCLCFVFVVVFVVVSVFVCVCVRVHETIKYIRFGCPCICVRVCV